MRKSKKTATRRLQLESLEKRCLLAADFEILKDIYTIDNRFFAPGPMKVVGQIGYFTAMSERHGRELWRTDGTESGTFLVKDIKPGAASGMDQLNTGPNFENVNGTLFFIAEDAVNGHEIWKSDGTTAGTVMVSDFSGNPSNYPVGLTNVNGTLFFSFNDGVRGEELWKTNGTANGTLLVKDVNPGAGGSYLSNLTSVGNTLYFTASANSVSEVWKSNGTAAGTIIVSDADIFNERFNPKFLTNVNGTLYFTASSSESTLFSDQLWKSNGTPFGTVMLKDDLQILQNNDFAVMNGTLFFNDSSGIWRSNGTAAGTVRIWDKIESEPNAANLTVVNNNLFFTVRGTLWKSNGTASGTAVVADSSFGLDLFVDFNRGPELTNVNGALFFVAGQNGGKELWKSNGFASGTVRVKDIFAGANDSSPKFLTNLNGTLFFGADDGGGRDELWKSDGTLSGTNKVDNRGRRDDSNPTSLTNVNGTMFFAATDGTSGVELWKSGGTAETTSRVKDIRFGEAGSSPTSLTNVGGTLYFVASSVFSGNELWKSDGTDAGTVLVSDIRAGLLGANPSSLTNVNGTLYFTADDGVRGRELWKVSRGVVSFVKDIRAGALGSNPANLVSVNNTLYFTANDGLGGIELWKSNGTPSGTVQVQDIASGVTGSTPAFLTNVNGTLYFSANDGTNGFELWKSTGTAASTTMVRSIRPGRNGSFPSELTNVAGSLFFRANDGTNGYELWRSNGTSSGTTQVMNIRPTGDSMPDNLTAVGNTLFFSATDSLGDKELWKSDGTLRGTVRVANILSSGSSSPSSLVNANGVLYFRATDPAGSVLWKSDGTTAGTVRVNEILLETGARNPGAVAVAGPLVFVAADTLPFGRELFAMNLSQGTTRDDIFTLQYSGAAPSGTVRVSRKTVGATTPPILLGTFSQASPFSIDGLSGNDTVIIEGSSSNDTFIADGIDLRINGSRLTLTNIENQTFVGKEGDDTYRFDADVLQGTIRIDELSGGIDTLDFSLTSSPVKLNLDLTSNQLVSGAFRVRLASLNSIENAVGGSGNDLIAGNSLANVLIGGPGNDTLNGGAGDDRLIGGEGSDSLKGGLGSDAMAGEAGDDTYLFDAAVSIQSDVVTELLNQGSDTLSFESLSNSVTLDLGSLAIQNIHENRTLQLNAIDTFEDVVGGSGNDVLTGNVLNNRLNGKGGSDNLAGGLGDDTYIFDAAIASEADALTELADEGGDTLDFGAIASGVTLNLATDSGQSVHTNRILRLNSGTTFEHAVGGSGNDVLTGNDRDNILVGNDGDDQLSSAGGRDIVIGGRGMDALLGGSGDDILIAGRTTHDPVISNTQRLLIEWTSANTYVQRIANLRAGVGSPAVSLKKSVNVVDDGAISDDLTGGEGNDWYFRALSDFIADPLGEIIDEL